MIGPLVIRLSITPDPVCPGYRENPKPIDSFAELSNQAIGEELPQTVWKKKTGVVLSSLQRFEV